MPASYTNIDLDNGLSFLWHESIISTKAGSLTIVIDIRI